MLINALLDLTNFSFELDWCSCGNIQTLHASCPDPFLSFLIKKKKTKQTFLIKVAKSAKIE